MSETPGLNIRFLAQGMLKVEPDQLPPDFYGWPRNKQIEWALAFWTARSRQELLDAVAYLEIQEDSVPDCLEVDNEDFTILAQTPAWEAYNLPRSSILKEETE